MESIGFMSVEILVAVVTFVLTAVVSVWRINASHTKRLDQFSISFNARMDALDKKLDTKVDTLDNKTDTKIDALGSKIDTKIDALGSKIDTKIDALRSEVRSDIGELRSMQHLLMDTMSKLASRISFIEGILDRRQEAPVDDASSLEVAQD